jgi:hypothetical protein
MKIIVPSPKKRPAGHLALFNNDLPFQPKKEKSRIRYKRQYKNYQELKKQQGTDDHGT